ncbi:MAG: hypothetical protein OXD44_02820 [Gammaproteobacteria bacterium]|nr:hypothetical protein [Gammaproteobacteria bacterium]
MGIVIRLLAISNTPPTPRVLHFIKWNWGYETITELRLFGWYLGSHEPVEILGWRSILRPFLRGQG